MIACQISCQSPENSRPSTSGVPVTEGVPRYWQIDAAPSEAVATKAAARNLAAAVTHLLNSDEATPKTTDGKNGQSIPWYVGTNGIWALVFGLLIFGFLGFLMTRPQLPNGRTWPYKIMALALVVTSGLFLIGAGYDERQIAPMMGLLGTLAGYVLGKEAIGEAPRENPGEKESRSISPTKTVGLQPATGA
jgi:hypothetical protein